MREELNVSCFLTVQVRTEEELVAAIETAKEEKDSLCFIEVILHKDDTSKELLEWGSRVAAANGRPPNPQ
jgi:pyruvate decarboxylase